MMFGIDWLQIWAFVQMLPVIILSFCLIALGVLALLERGAKRILSRKAKS